LGNYPFRPNIVGPIPKIKIPLPIFFGSSLEVSKKVCQVPVGQKLREEIAFLETGHIWARLYPGGWLI
jgi:hypothetical protein